MCKHPELGELHLLQSGKFWLQMLAMQLPGGSSQPFPAITLSPVLQEPMQHLISSCAVTTCTKDTETSST